MKPRRKNIPRINKPRIRSQLPLGPEMTTVLITGTISKFFYDLKTGKNMLKQHRETD